jgi:hypothetical protein
VCRSISLPTSTYLYFHGSGPRYSHSSSDSQGASFHQENFLHEGVKIKEQGLSRGKGDGDRVTAVSWINSLVSDLMKACLLHCLGKAHHGVIGAGCTHSSN